MNYELLTAKDLATELGVTTAALYQMRYLGDAPPAIKIRGRLRWRRMDIDTWLDGLSEASK